MAPVTIIRALVLSRSGWRLSSLTALAVFKIASGGSCYRAVICVLGCLPVGSRQDHPVHIPRGGHISPEPSFTSWQRRRGCALSPLLVECRTVPRCPAGSRLLAALLAARSVLDPRIKRRERLRLRPSEAVWAVG
jgi:hypothetical protein